MRNSKIFGCYSIIRVQARSYNIKYFFLEIKPNAKRRHFMTISYGNNIHRTIEVSSPSAPRSDFGDWENRSTSTIYRQWHAHTHTCPRENRKTFVPEKKSIVIHDWLFEGDERWFIIYIYIHCTWQISNICILYIIYYMYI